MRQRELQQSKRMRWIQGSLGAVLVLVGAAGSARVLAPDGGLRSSSVEGWMFVGPALVTFGILLLWTVRRSGAASDREARGPLLLLQIGLAFLVPPGAAWTWRAVSDSGLADYAWNVTAFTLGVPGLALAVTGAALLAWRSIG